MWNRQTIIKRIRNRQNHLWNVTLLLEALNCLRPENPHCFIWTKYSSFMKHCNCQILSSESEMTSLRAHRLARLTDCNKNSQWSAFTVLINGKTNSSTFLQNGRFIVWNSKRIPSKYRNSATESHVPKKRSVAKLWNLDTLRH